MILLIFFGLAYSLLASLFIAQSLKAGSTGFFLDTSLILVSLMVFILAFSQNKNKAKTKKIRRIGKLFLLFYLLPFLFIFGSYVFYYILPKNLDWAFYGSFFVTSSGIVILVIERWWPEFLLEKEQKIRDWWEWQKLPNFPSTGNSEDFHWGDDSRGDYHNHSGG